VFAMLTDPAWRANLDFDNRREYTENYIPGHPEKDPESGRSFNISKGEFKIFKTHHPTVIQQFNDRVLDTRFYCYVVRHPLDVFLSYLNYLHFNRDALQWAYSLPLLSVDDHVRTGTINDFLGMFMACGTISTIDGAGSWFSSIRYWMNIKREYNDFVFVVKYEDCVADPVSGFSEVANFVGGSSIEEALEWCSKTYPKDGGFFWKMRPEYYKEILPKYEIIKFRDRMGKMLEELEFEV